MDARDRLRRYLEQRREMGESEFALDSMSIDEALKVIGTTKGASAPPMRPLGGENSGSTTNAPRAEVRERAAPPESADWREALRASGATPEATPAAPPAASPPVTAARAATAVPSGGAPLDVPPGLVVAKPASPGVTDIDAAPSLDVIADMVRRCTRCPLHQTAIQGVPGEGNPHARFVVVGEAPGATEDEIGRPFVGAAGQLLTKILAAINLRREDVFICNVIKHRPPGNRNPLPNEIAACSPYLIRQLELIQPGVILALGTFAAQTLLETKESIGKLRGRVHRYHDIPLIVTYHPAALLRNPAWKRPAWEDVQLARRILDSTPDPRA
ncbi:MAG: uracil-DNA glycosylase [Gemmatimonadaceae bacterium]